MPASRCGFKTKLQCSTPRRRRRRPTDLMTGPMFATKDYGAIGLHRSVLSSAIPRRPMDQPESGYRTHIEGSADSKNCCAAQLSCTIPVEWRTCGRPGPGHEPTFGKQVPPLRMRTCGATETIHA